MTLSFARLGAVGRLKRDFARRKSTCGSSTDVKGRETLWPEGYLRGGRSPNERVFLSSAHDRTRPPSKLLGDPGPQDLVRRKDWQIAEKECRFSVLEGRERPGSFLLDWHWVGNFGGEPEDAFSGSRLLRKARACEKHHESAHRILYFRKL